MMRLLALLTVIGVALGGCQSLSLRKSTPVPGSGFDAADADMGATGPGLQPATQKRFDDVPLPIGVTEDLERYRSLWREATFLFMPSRAETFGAVYAEAAANGVPSIALDIGGVGDAVVDGENGRLLPRESDAESCA